MQTHRKSTFLILLLVLSCTAPSVRAQQHPVVGCVDRNIRLQADEIKQHYTAQGFAVYRDAMLNMESMTPFPVMVQFNRGQMYQIVFVGHAASSRLKMELFDGQDHKIDDRFTMRNREQPNYLLYTFVPERTDTYLLTFLQKLKNENMCGSLCILALPSDKQSATITPYHQ